MLNIENISNIMKTKLVAVLVLASAVGLAWNIWPKKSAQSETNPKIILPPVHFSERKPVDRRMNGFIESQLNDIGLSLNNSVRIVAQASLLTAPSFHRCQLVCQMKKDNTFQYMVMSFRMGLDSSITTLVIDGKTISLPEPIFGIPLGDGNLMKDVIINISTVNQVGEYAGNGFAEMSMASRGDSIKVKLIREEFFVREGIFQLLAKVE